MGLLVLFFWVQSYLHSAYIDYGGTLFYQPVPARRSGSMAAPLALPPLLVVGDNIPAV